MKRLFILAALAAPLCWTACSGDKPTDAEDVVPKGMKAIDLWHLGQPVKINIPDSTADYQYAKVDTAETPAGVQIRLKASFDILVNAASGDEADLNKMKELIKSTDAGENTFMDGDSSMLVWETKFGDLSYFHFYRVVKTTNGTYFVRDNNSIPDNQFKKEDLDRMINSAKSLRARPEAKKPDA